MVQWLRSSDFNASNYTKLRKVSDRTDMGSVYVDARPIRRESRLGSFIHRKQEPLPPGDRLYGTFESVVKNVDGRGRHFLREYFYDGLSHISESFYLMNK